MSSRCGGDPGLREVPTGGLRPGASLVAQCVEHTALSSSHFVCSYWENVDKHYCACESPAEAFLGVLYVSPLYSFSFLISSLISYALCPQTYP